MKYKERIYGTENLNDTGEHLKKHEKRGID